VIPSEPVARTTCHLSKVVNGEFVPVETFEAGKKAVDCSLKSVFLQFNRRTDAEFQALAYVMKNPGCYRLSVSRSPCMSCVWALWQARREHDISIAFPD